jgi:hypothetical protein
MLKSGHLGNICKSTGTLDKMMQNWDVSGTSAILANNGLVNKDYMRNL